MFYLAFELRSGGSEKDIIDFNAVGYKLLDGYFPEAVEGDKPVTESFNILLSGTGPELAEMVQEIELALSFAREHPEGPDGVWMLFSAQDGALDACQSRLSGGALLLDARLNLRLKSSALKAEVVVERNPFWEAIEPTTLNVTNRGGTSTSANIVNHQDAGGTDDFYVEIAGEDVEGGLPAPAVIEYTNTVNDGVLVDHLMVGHFAASAPLDPPTAGSLVFEGTGASDGGCSSGTYKACTWSTALESQIASWAFASESFRQRYYKIIARMKEGVAYTDLYLKGKLLSGSTVLAETRWSLVTANDVLTLVGSLKIPPYRQGLYVNLGNLTLGLYEKRAGGAGTLNLDFLAALPMDGWRQYGAITGLAYNETLIDDPVNEILYSAAGGAYKVTHVIDEGVPVMLVPGVKNVLYFLHDSTTGTAAIARTASVAVKYHPRKKTI